MPLLSDHGAFRMHPTPLFVVLVAGTSTFFVCHPLFLCLFLYLYAWSSFRVAVAQWCKKVFKCAHVSEVKHTWPERGMCAPLINGGWHISQGCGVYSMDTAMIWSVQYLIGMFIPFVPSFFQFYQRVFKYGDWGVDFARPAGQDLYLTQLPSYEYRGLV